MARRYGRAPRGRRLRVGVPHGRWKTTTLVAGLRTSGVVAPFVLDGPINRAVFEAYVEKVLVPALWPGDVVILDNLSSHKGPRVRALIEAAGAKLLYLPPLYGAFDVKLLFQALPRCRAPSFSRVLVSSCPEIGTDRPHTSGSMGSGLATAHRDDRREARPRARIVAPQPCMRPIHVGSEP